MMNKLTRSNQQMEEAEVGYRVDFIFNFTIKTHILFKSRFPSIKKKKKKMSLLFG